MDFGRLSQIAHETVQVLQAGRYVNRAGGRVHIAEGVERSCSATRVIRPEQWAAIVAEVRGPAPTTGVGRPPRVEVTGETTLGAVRRLFYADGRRDIAALNFASANTAGGGFLGG